MLVYIIMWLRNWRWYGWLYLKELFHSQVLENAPIKPFAKEVVDKLVEEGNQIIFVTARNKEGDRVSDSYKISKNLLANKDRII